eukprot:TRINITY_DN11051_c0_g1_i1.p1 TRINITY_DN11051_c0_g1~~TRINITY_DN11051_c0_g1_i1.p1  ORF type:complete len:386 (-),score=68.18 TRINITY_DN11051_c0_g1_i1:6-1163(-)
MQEGSLNSLELNDITFTRTTEQADSSLSEQLPHSINLNTVPNIAAQVEDESLGQMPQLIADSHFLLQLSENSDEGSSKKRQRLNEEEEEIKKRRKGNYMCNICHQEKKGHMCSKMACTGPSELCKSPWKHTPHGRRARWQNHVVRSGFPNKNAHLSPSLGGSYSSPSPATSPSSDLLQHNLSLPPWHTMSPSLDYMNSTLPTQTSDELDNENVHLDVIIDTDGGIDDLVSVFFALKHTQYSELRAITTVFGNVDAAQAAENVARVVDTFFPKKNIPIFKGSNNPILNLGKRPASWEGHGNEGVGEWLHKVEDENVDHLNRKRNEHAAVALVKMINESPGYYTIIMLGPMTNLAMAVRLDPCIAEKVKGIYFYGGKCFWKRKYYYY